MTFVKCIIDLIESFLIKEALRQEDFVSFDEETMMLEFAPRPGWRTETVKGIILRSYRSIYVKIRTLGVGAKTFVASETIGGYEVEVRVREGIVDPLIGGKAATVSFKINNRFDDLEVENRVAIARWLYSQWPEAIAFAYAMKAKAIMAFPNYGDSIPRVQIYQKLGFTILEEEDPIEPDFMVYWL